MTSLFLALLPAWAATATIDGQPADIGPVVVGLDGYVAAIDRTVPAMTHGRVTFHRDGPSTCSLRVAGKTLLRMPYEAADGKMANDRVAQIFDPPGSSTPVRTLALTDVPHDDTTEDGRPIVGFDIEELGGLLGVTVDLDRGRVEMLTPAFWGQMLNLSEEAIERLKLNPLPLIPDFGISPPARVMTMWVRPAQAGPIQLYRLSDGVPERMIGRNAVTGKWVTRTSADPAQAFPATPDTPVRAETQHFENRIGKYGLYAAIVCASDIGTEDPVDAINSGRLKPGQFAVVGLRQRVAANPVTFSDTLSKPGETPVSVAKRVRNDVRLLTVLNGLQNGRPIPTGTRIVYASAVTPTTKPPLGYTVVGPYVVRGTETVATLAKSWGVTEDQVLEANPELEESPQLQIGDLVEQISPRSSPAPKPGLLRVTGTATLKRNAPLRPLDRPDSPAKLQLDEGQIVEILGKSPQGTMLYVKADGATGFVVTADLQLNGPLKAPAAAIVADVPAPAAPRPGPAPSSRLHPALQIAFQHLGTPYKWGGANLRKGIDCSNFVSAVFTNAGLPCPAPPVLNQERDPIVHYKSPGLLARYRGNTVRMPARPVPFSALQPGDRIILQYRLSDAPKTRHTGVYAGRVRVRGRIYENAVVHASCSGVKVDELTRGWLWKNYKFSVRTHRNVAMVARGPAR